MLEMGSRMIRGQPDTPEFVEKTGILYVIYYKCLLYYMQSTVLLLC